MTRPDPALIAQSLLDAYDHRRPIAPLTDSWPDLTLAHAYSVQLHQVRHWVGRGRRVRGHKIGLTSAAIQRQLGVDQPDYGHLTDDMFYSESQPIPIDRFISPKVQPEIAFVLGRELKGPGITAAQAISSVDYVLPALEIIDSRISEWKITLVDTVADNASSGAVVLGSTPITLPQLATAGLSLRTMGCVLYQGGQVVGSGAGGAALGSPINALVWLANTLGRVGISLAAESVILPGSIKTAVPVVGDDTVTARFAGIGSVTATFRSGLGSPELTPSTTLEEK
ncbi:2-keto-4-pentenoate hydratase [Rhodococcus erythropolis]|uniref:2-keto-4-pentenoate hydratase n=1 Tax=Rhodococcus erythropolis TaxID=1833 RepID=UPI001BE6C238|nr:2-keto-4-pentenoate hydratase [Rhodococcus erythropolis]MBT2268966.1 2-keto-4-pentenoate hydratase [Rhodococcus erythropolis]